MKSPVYTIQVLALGAFQVNQYLLVSETERAFAVVDAPGVPDLAHSLLNAGYACRWIALTHGHIDHVARLASLRNTLKCPVLVHEADAPMLAQVAGHPFQAMLGAEAAPEPDRLLRHGDTLAFDGAEFRIIHTPGHTPGGICLLDEAAGVLFTGDTLFRDSVGRTDLPGGDMDQLQQSIRQRLWPLSDNVRVLPGHGPETGIGYEKQHNPFV